MTNTVQQVVKRSRFLHSTVKLARLVPASPGVVSRDWRRTADIFRILPNTMLPLPALANVYECARAVEEDGIEGNVAECGVWAGGAIGLMALANQRYGHRPRVYHLFDSFEGLPQPAEQDVDVLEAFRADHPDLEPDDGADPEQLVAIGACATAAYGRSPLEDVTDLFEGVLKSDRSMYKIHKGWFQDTIPGAADEVGPLAILRLDGDWYESTKTCLEGLFDHVVPGGFLLLDDYGFFQGCTQAVDEFLDARAIPRDQLTVEGWGAYLRRPS